MAGLVAWLLIRPDHYVAPTPTVSASRPDPGGAARTLRAFVDVVDARDPDAAAALAPRGDAGARSLLQAVVTNAEGLDVADLSMRYVDTVGAVGGDGGWQAAVDVTWRFEGYDDGPAHEEVTVAFRRDGDVVAITGFGGGARRSPLWLSGPLEVRRSPQALVLVAGDAAEADTVATRAERAVPVVQQVLPRWPGRLVVEVPSSEEGLDAVLAAEPGTYAEIAAVSASVDGTLTQLSQVHVFVNPEVYDELDDTGGQVVMSHEATHVATGAPLTSGVPLWLLEGFADYVALRDVDLPITTTAGQVIAQVRRDGVPDALPGQSEFDASATHLGAAYEAAWLACRVLADAAGEDALVRLYQRVSRTGDLTGALEAETGMSEAQLTRRWQQRLRDLADGATDGA